MNFADEANTVPKRRKKVQRIQVEIQVIIFSIWQHKLTTLNVYKAITGCHGGAAVIGAVEMCTAETSNTFDICVASKHAFWWTKHLFFFLVCVHKYRNLCIHFWPIVFHICSIEKPKVFHSLLNLKRKFHRVRNRSLALPFRIASIACKCLQTFLMLLFSSFFQTQDPYFGSIAHR